MSIPIATFTEAVKAVHALLDLVPLNVATSLLTEEARKRANAAADIAEVVKFGSDGNKR